MENGLILPYLPAPKATEARIGCAQTELCVEGSGNAPIVHRGLGPGDNPEYRLPRKASEAARTPNRHRRLGRTFQGARVIHAYGTRQHGRVTSGEAPPPAMRAAVKAPRRLFIKDTGLC